MKKILLFTMMMFIATLVFAQTLTEGFETWPPVDWTIVQGPDSPTNDITQTATESYTGSYSARFSSYTSASAYDEYMITPQLVTAVGDQTVSFWYQKSTYGTELFKVGWSSTGTNVATDFTWSDEITVGSTDWQQYTKTDLPVGTTYVAIHYYSDYMYYMYVDDVAGPELYVNPVPPDPTTLIAPADLASRLPVNGDLSWNAASGADGYYLYFGSDGGGTTDPTDIVNGTDLGDVTSYSYTDLGFLTTYYWAVVPYNTFGTTTGYDIWEFETISETAVPFTIDLIDSYGDGWDGGMVDLSVEGVLVLDDITILDGFGETFTFLVEDDETVLVDYTAGSFPGENSYDIVNEEDVVIYTSPAPPEASYSFIVGAVVIPNVFFSEYIEGSSNNKAIEIYNGTEETIDLANFVIYGNYNGNPWSEIYPFEAETIVEAGDVYVLANDEADQAILNQADVVFAYGDPWYMTAFNGDDVRALGYIAQGDTTIIDFIGLYDLVDPGAGWDVAGIAEATANHTLVRKDAITLGNTDWVASAGTDADDSEWIVNDEDTFGFLGWHIIEPSYISGVVTLDAFGDVTDTEISVEVGEDVYSVYADETGFYFMNIVPGTYDVVADMPGYDVMTTAGVECVVGVVSTVDFALTVIPETLWPPVNLTAEIDASGVNVAWTAPTQYGWNGYYDGIASLTWAAGERAVLYDVTDFGFSYPMTLSQISHGFYHHPSYPWLDDTTFTFKIYDADGTTVLFESAVQTALAYPANNILELDTPITVTDNFWVSVVTNEVTGMPSSIFDASDDFHGYLGEPGAWELYADWATLVYIMGGEGTELLTYSKKATLPTISSRKVKRTNYAKIDEFAPTENTRDLLSFNVFRDAVQLNTEPVYDVSYVDLAVPAGEYIYHATALWNFGESDASNTATVNLAFGDLSGTVTEDGTPDPIEGAIVAAGDYSTVTLPDGDYLIEDMLVGTYEVNCSALGYVNADPVTVEIITDEITVQDFVLVPTPPDPPEGVSVDPYSWLCTWSPPGGSIINDDFEAYNVGEYLGLQSSWWSTWSNEPGTGEDAFVSDEQALSGTKSVKIEGTTDLLLVMADNYTTGAYVVEIHMYVPTGGHGYYNLQKSTTIGEEWAFQVDFPADGTAIVDADGFASATFAFNFDEWMDLQVMVDIDADWAEFYYNGTLIREYQWSLGTSGNAGLHSLGGMNIYANPLDPLFYVDDLDFRPYEPARDLIGYNVFLDNVELASSITALQHQLVDLIGGTEYTAGVQAVYDEGLSEIVEHTFTALYSPILPPQNLDVVTENVNDALLTWEPAGTGGGEAFLDGFEGYDDFVLDFAPWTQHDGDGSTTYSITNYTFPNQGYTGSYIIFNPSTVDPPLTDADPHSGDKMAACFAATSLLNDDWMIAPQVTISSGDEASFFARSYTDQYGMERFNVAVSTTGTAPADFTVISGATYLEAPIDWTEYSFDLSSYAGQSVYVAIQCVTADAFIFFVDDFHIGAPADVVYADVPAVNGRTSKGIVDFVQSKVTSVAKRNKFVPGKKVSMDVPDRIVDVSVNNPEADDDDTRVLLGYNIFKDGTQIGTVGDGILEYLDESLAAGVYEYYVTGVYSNGESDPSNTVEITISLPPPLSFNAVSQGPVPNVICTWLVPVSTRALSGYKIYRNDEEIGETTSLIFFDTLVPTGTYLYHATAIYDDSYESEPSNVVEVGHVDANGILKPTVTELTGNYPNPFNPTTTISFSLAEASHVSINIYNMRGQLVKTLVNTELENDFHEIVWSGKDNSGKSTASGVYFYKMKTQNYNSTKKMILMK